MQIATSARGAKPKSKQLILSHYRFVASGQASRYPARQARRNGHDQETPDDSKSCSQRKRKGRQGSPGASPCLELCSLVCHALPEELAQCVVYFVFLQKLPRLDWLCGLVRLAGLYQAANYDSSVSHRVFRAGAAYHDDSLVTLDAPVFFFSRHKLPPSFQSKWQYPIMCHANLPQGIMTSCREPSLLDIQVRASGFDLGRSWDYD